YPQAFSAVSTANMLSLVSNVAFDVICAAQTPPRTPHSATQSQLRTTAFRRKNLLRKAQFRSLQANLTGFRLGGQTRERMQSLFGKDAGRVPRQPKTRRLRGGPACPTRPISSAGSGTSAHAFPKVTRNALLTSLEP